MTNLPDSKRRSDRSHHDSKCRSDCNHLDSKTRRILRNVRDGNLTKTEASELLGVTRKTIYSWLESYRHVLDEKPQKIHKRKAHK